ncbi:MAG: hypothetical protein NTV51_12640 [Verrucomicrobia bacterium]|nr:hypothetical protein [Verrucomicrobiota bacterium]
MSSLINGTPHLVTFSKRHGGQQHQVSIAELEINPLYRFCHCLVEHKTPELVALCIDKPVEWLNQIDVKSYAELSKKCIDVNFQNAMTLMEGDPVIALKLGPLVMQMMTMATTMNLDPVLLEKVRALAADLKLQPSAGTPSNGSSSAPAPSGSATPTGT